MFIPTAFQATKAVLAIIRTGRMTVASPRVHTPESTSKTICVPVRPLAVICRGHRELVVENLAFRPQLRLETREPPAALVEPDRLFWIALAKSWRHCREALVLVQPDTVPL
jgi:hypothetical protein